MKNGKRIALINPRVESFSGNMPPLGILYIAAILEKNGYEVKIFDIYPYDDRSIPAMLDYQPEIIGMTVLTDYWPRAKYISKTIKEKLPNSFFVVGGVHVTALPEESILELNADAAVIGEGEYTFLELCVHLNNGTDWKGTKGIIYRDEDRNFIATPGRPYISNLDEIPFPARHLLNFDDYLMPPGIIRGRWTERSTTVMTGRGCPFQCIWCGSQCTFGRKVRYRSIDNVIQEIIQLIRDFHVDAVWFIDDTFTLNKERVIEFCEKVISNNIKLIFGCQAHVKTADEAMFKLMKKAGFVQVDFGVESGSDKVLKALKKNSDAVSIKKAFSCAKSAGLRTLGTFMFGSPSETEEDVEATIKLTKEIRPSFVSAYFLTPYPGTELMKMSQENNWIKNLDRDEMGLKKRPMLQIHFSENELYKIRSRFLRKYILRNFFIPICSPHNLIKLSSLFMQYPKGIFLGIKKYFKTFVFNDLVFAFLVYYVQERADRQKRLRDRRVSS
ncbi:hypothetical protein A2276_05905 [candidate division WOR-1 bacterium RIFOXYA12_FULL_43_27]|uniref:Uncharacterized protein n=1 Tax=candidate division WOR-1 bacterium RIFOXYC2_FULL_46_14 TaxID=1802587 RepID=A0A1F4U3B4_UNCSA|nr:MAG: hypothetical protein A2276_05905 [candidate division WOR-1 bacterium RIFOXYA12_FULL_43_27]OGC20196.1 MAG: hypothetical protein A2292_03905 [candidate division WOR-1 bacterium RIFOXYB2_FULL_46_45]OGC32066.1 MAG: hypothetical protein A2232_07540 [candidate division WOR-1 bacterium RIFOXYA2_FULL_46_56]OGC39468.1 MAG: hypothetical protein A2438_07905 [candidate division WOR-1 bacterium RIFOXYC2_FULL_46_14]